MKLNLLLTITLIMSTTTCLINASEEKGSLDYIFYHNLYFLVNHERHIKACKAYGNMKFLVPPAELLGKIFFEAVPLSEADRNNLARGFDKAQKDDTKVKVEYTLENILFCAEITPLAKSNRTVFFVRVWEPKE